MEYVAAAVTVLTLIGLLWKCFDWIRAPFEKQKTDQLAEVKNQLLAWFESAHTRGVYGRFCPSRADVVELFDEIRDQPALVLRALNELVHDGFLVYSGGRYLVNDTLYYRAAY